MKKIRNYFYRLFAIVIAIVMLPIRVVSAAENASDYKDLILSYYECVNEERHSDIQELYGQELNNFVAPFFQDFQNEVEHNGIYNVKSAKVTLIEKMAAEETALYGDEIYSDIEIFFVKCNMDVYVSDKYYQDGANYFKFYIGLCNDGDAKIANVEIPSYSEIQQYDECGEDVEKFQRIRNEMIYGIVEPYYTDRPKYIDTVANPKTIRVETYGTVNFYDYCRGVAANEMNNVTTDAAARACAMAIKMFSIHFVLTAASGTNYDIDLTQQSYKPTTEISSRAANAVDYVNDYFMLGAYGEVFKAFFQQEYKSQGIAQYCYQYGGALSHYEAYAFGEAGKFWQDILRYYYNKVSSVEYITAARKDGAIIITTAHVHDWSNARYCPTCGALVE